ncbi:unnamed protein product [Schistosoma margrebowiei]|uniref:Uncharacterized protein n=1 Tax=Schistosoma margrebowiei TaxID=48269 RepID=A0A183MGF9_9TREM|nr:unnamed protein product [Schistosoma margrebowiei]
MDRNVLRRSSAYNTSKSVNDEGNSEFSNKISESVLRKPINSSDKGYIRNSALRNTNGVFSKIANFQISKCNDDCLDEILILRKLTKIASSHLDSRSIKHSYPHALNNIQHRKFVGLADMKFTRVEELRVQLETAFAEIKRLKEQNHILSDQCSEKKRQSTIKPKRSFSSENNQSNFQIRTLGRVIKDLDQQKQELIAKNHCLVSKIQKLYRHLSSNDVKEDITPYRACQDDECNVQVLSHNVTNQAPKVSKIVQRDENMISELESAKAQIANLQHLNKTLSESCEKMKKDYEIMEKIRNENTNDKKLENGGVVVKMKIPEKDIVKQVKNVSSTKDHYEDDENAFNHRNEENQSEMKHIQERFRFNGQSNFYNPLPVSINCPNSY